MKRYFLTNAPESYDWAYTRTVSTGHKAPRQAGEFRLVEIDCGRGRPENADYQVGRYNSGLYATWNLKDWFHFFPKSYREIAIRDYVEYRNWGHRESFTFCIDALDKSAHDRDAEAAVAMLEECLDTVALMTAGEYEEAEKAALD